MSLPHSETTLSCLIRLGEFSKTTKTFLSNVRFNQFLLKLWCPVNNKMSGFTKGQMLIFLKSKENMPRLI